MGAMKYEIQKKLPLVLIFFVPYLNSTHEAMVPLALHSH